MARQNNIAWMGKAKGIVRTPVDTKFAKVSGWYISIFVVYPWKYIVSTNRLQKSILPGKTRENVYHILLYICTVNRSMRRIWTESSFSSSGWYIKVTMVSVISWQCNHAFHAVFFSESQTCLMSNHSQWMLGRTEEPGIYSAQAVHLPHALECPCNFFHNQNLSRDLWDQGFGMGGTGGLTVPQHLGQHCRQTPPYDQPWQHAEDATSSCCQPPRGMSGLDRTNRGVDLKVVFSWCAYYKTCCSIGCSADKFSG